MQKSMFGVLAETEDRISCRCFNFKSAWLRSPASPSLCSKSFLFLSHASSMPWKSQSQVGALPVSPPGQRAPSHMPCRLARSSTPLNWLIATQEKGGEKKIQFCCHLLPMWANMEFIKEGCSLTPPSPYAHLSSHQHRSRGDFQLPWHRLPLSLPVANFANEIKQTNVSFVCQKWCSGLCGEERKKKSMQP